MLVQIPSPTNGYLNLGDAVVLLGAYLLGPAYGAAAGGVGPALADLLSGYAMYVPGTLVIKALMGLTAALLYRATGSEGILRGDSGETARLLAEAAADYDGVLLDLGVSSHQLDEVSRGFSYQGDAPLDMRMSQSGPTAADLVNTASRAELCRILKEYGEEPYAWQIAGKIESARAAAPIETTAQLVQAVASALPPAVRRKDKNPARRTFQALRIAVNGELDALSEGLDVLFAALKPGGRMCVITFHSLEDRLVKQRFRQWATACTCPPEFPVCVCGGKARAKLITKKPVEAAAGEQAENRRARSAKLRILEKL